MNADVNCLERWNPVRPGEQGHIVHAEEETGSVEERQHPGADSHDKRQVNASSEFLEAFSSQGF